MHSKLVYARQIQVKKKVLRVSQHQIQLDQQASRPASESPVSFALKSSSLSRGRKQTSQGLQRKAEGGKLNSLSCSGALHPWSVYYRSSVDRSIDLGVFYIYSRY